MVVKFVKEEGIEEVVIRNVAIMVLLYADDIYFKRRTKAYEGFGRILQCILNSMPITLEQRLCL